jgi:hypothetical protein
MKKITLLIAAFCLSYASNAQEKLTIQGQTGLALPYTDVKDFSYTGLNHNIILGTGLGYYLDENNQSRIRFDLMAGKMASSSDLVAWDNQFFETNVSFEYNILSLIDEGTKFKLNLRAGVGMAIFTARAIDRQTRVLISEVPANFNSQRAFEWGNFGLLGANFSFPLSERLALDLGYNHRFMFSQNLDALPSSSNDTYGVVTVGLTASLKSGKNPKTVEIEPEVLNDLRTRVKVYESLESERESERISNIEMQNLELGAQVELLKNEIDSIKLSKDQANKEANTSDVLLDMPANVAKFRVVVASLATKARAEQFVVKSGLSMSDVEIFYIDNIKSYRVVIGSSDKRAEADQILKRAKNAFKDAWLAQF